MTYEEELLGPSKAFHEAQRAKAQAALHRKYAAELRAMLEGKPWPGAPNLPGLTPTEAQALAEQVVAGQAGATPGEVAVARAYLAKTKI